jgi:cation:H+ antiporter
MLNLVLLMVGLVLLLGGANYLVQGVSALAQRLGVPPVVIGMTVVAFGTSTPELAINIASAVTGETQLAFGNVVGACLVNIGFVLGVTALVRPLTVERSIITREIPMLLLTVGALFVLCADGFFGLGGNVISRQDGVILLMLFGVFLYYTVSGLLFGRKDDAFVQEVGAAGETVSPVPGRMLVDIALVVGGLVAVAGGGRLAVAGAVGIAQALQVPDVIIGLTIVSLGTTLPELVTSITAARKGLSDLAIGNVVGSCIFNLLMIGGTVGSIRPVPLPAGGMVDVAALALLSALLLPICLHGPRNINRWEGAALLLLYAGYTAYRTVTGMA